MRGTRIHFEFFSIARLADCAASCLSLRAGSHAQGHARSAARSWRIEYHRKTRVVVIHFVGLLGSRHANLLAVHDNDVVTHIHVGRVLGLVLTAQAMCDFRRESTERHVFNIDHQPIVVYVICLGAVCFHDQCPQGDIKGARMLLDSNGAFNRYFAR